MLPGQHIASLVSNNDVEMGTKPKMGVLDLVVCRAKTVLLKLCPPSDLAFQSLFMCPQIESYSVDKRHVHTLDYSDHITSDHFFNARSEGGSQNKADFFLVLTRGLNGRLNK